MVALALVGILFVFVGFVIVAVSLLTSAKSMDVKGAGVVLVGPIPIVFGSDAKWVSVAVALTIVLIILSFGLRLV